MSTKPTYQEFGKEVNALEKEAAARIRAQETPGASEARYHELAGDQTELICRWLPDGTLTFVNQAFCRYFGKQPEDFIGNSFMPFIPKGDIIDRLQAQQRIQEQEIFSQNNWKTKPATLKRSIRL